MTTTTTDTPDVEAMRLYVDSIDCKPQTFDWSENPREEFGDFEDGHGTPWSFTEYREPEDGDEARCEDCGEDILFLGQLGLWVHKDGYEADPTVGNPEPEGDEDPEYDHDAAPDSEYTQDPEYCEGPMMNYWYPVEIRDQEGAAKRLAGLPVCVVEVGGETGLALTGGGMDLSWEICEAFIRIGSYPPFHFVSQLPKMATTWRESHELVLAVGRKVIEIQRGWVESAAKRLEDTATWMKDRQWEIDNERRRGAQS